MAKQPYIPLYIGDWIQDTDCLTIEAEGAWLRIIFKCWKNNGMFSATKKVFARVCKVEEQHFASILLEWKTNDICDIVEADNGIITVLSRRIRRDKEISQTKAANGSKGGSKTQAKAKAKLKQIPDNDNEVDNENENGFEYQLKESEKKVETIEFTLSQEMLSKEDVFEGLFGDARWFGEIARMHKDKDLEKHFDECYEWHIVKPAPPTELWEWKQKFSSWLTFKRASNGISKKTGADANTSRREAFAKRHSSNTGS